MRRDLTARFGECKRLVEALARIEEAHGEGARRRRQHVGVGFRGIECAPEACDRGAVVAFEVVHVAERAQRLRSQRRAARLLERTLQHRPGSGGISRQEPVAAGELCASASLLTVLGRREEIGRFAELGGSRAPAAAAGAVSRALEGAGHLLVRGVTGEGEVPGPLLLVLRELRQAGVQGAPRLRIEHPVRGRGE